MKRIATALAALLLAAGISWGQDPDLTGFLEQLENVNGRMATAMNNDDKEEMENLYTEIVVMYEQQPGSVKKTAAPIMGGVWYNLACLRSLRGDTDGQWTLQTSIGVRLERLRLYHERPRPEDGPRRPTVHGPRRKHPVRHRSEEGGHPRGERTNDGQNRARCTV